MPLHSMPRPQGARLEQVMSSQAFNPRWFVLFHGFWGCLFLGRPFKIALFLFPNSNRKKGGHKWHSAPNHTKREGVEPKIAFCPKSPKKTRGTTQKLETALMGFQDSCPPHSAHGSRTRARPRSCCAPCRTSTPGAPIGRLCLHSLPRSPAIFSPIHTLPHPSFLLPFYVFCFD